MALNQRETAPALSRAQRRAKALGAFMLALMLVAGGAACASNADGNAGTLAAAASPASGTGNGAAAANDHRSFARVTATVLGIYSPRGVFNLSARLLKLEGLERYKFDIPDSLMVLEFKPGVVPEPAQIRDVMVKGGYQPGPFKIEHLPVSEAEKNGVGWMEPPKITSDSAFVRWLQMNFWAGP